MSILLYLGVEDEDSEEIVVTKRPNKRTYHVIKKKPKKRDVRKETMREYIIHKKNFKSGIPIRSDFKCDVCSKEIQGNKVFVGLSDKEVHSFIREEKNIYHRACLPYRNAYPHLGILILLEERVAFEKHGQLQEEKEEQSTSEEELETEEKVAKKKPKKRKRKV